MITQFALPQPALTVLTHTCPESIHDPQLFPVYAAGVRAGVMMQAWSWIVRDKKRPLACPTDGLIGPMPVPHKQFAARFGEERF